MIPLTLLATDEPPLRVSGLHALVYCERLFYLEEVENIRVANEDVYSGRRLHATLAPPEEEGESVQLELSSPRWGLVGRVDAVRRRDGQCIPYEHKRGKPRRALDDGRPEPWPSDRIQVIAYAVLLEEALGTPVPEARIRYHGSQQTVTVTMTADAREELQQVIEQARRVRRSLERPPITADERRCAKCSLAPVCLPDEVRYERPQNRPIQSLFPPDRQGASLHVVAQGTFIGSNGNSVVVRHPDLSDTRCPVHQLEALLIHGYSQISTQAVRLCARNDVVVHWLTTSGHHVASLVPSIGQVQRRIRQYQALTDEETCLRLARALALAKVSGQYRYLLRSSRSQPSLRHQMASPLHHLQDTLKQIARADHRDSLRGLEGAAAVHYFAGLRLLLNDRVPEELRYVSRSRRPPLDRLNALLSYGYGLLHTAVMRALLASGLEPALGFFHTPRSSAYPLCLDLMELFRVPLWDLVVIGSLNRGQWDPAMDFQVTTAKIWLSEAGRRKAISLFESRLQDSCKHPILNCSISYVRLIELEARLLEKEWTGEPGLFAKFRLR